MQITQSNIQGRKLSPEDVRTVAPALEAYTQERLYGDVWKRPGLTPRVALAALPAFGVLAVPAPWSVHLVGSVAVFAVAALVLRAIPSELFHALGWR